MVQDHSSTPHPRSPTSLYEQNYRKLEKILGRPLPELESGIVYRLRAEGFMDLVGEVLSICPETGAMIVSLATTTSNGETSARTPRWWSGSSLPMRINPATWRH